MSVHPLPSHSRWVADARGEDRAVRVTAHAERGLLVLSTWKRGTCTSTVRLRPDDAAALVAALVDGLVELGAPPAARPGDEDSATVEERLHALEERLARLDPPAG